MFLGEIERTKAMNEELRGFLDASLQHLEALRAQGLAEPGQGSEPFDVEDLGAFVGAPGFFTGDVLGTGF